MNAKRTYTARVWDDAEHTTQMLIDGNVVTMIDMSLLARRNEWDDATARRASSHIAHNPELYHAVKSIGNWIVPENTVVELPPTGTKRSSWGDGCERIIVGLTPDQIKTVLSWSKPDGTPVKYRFPTRERHERKSKKTTVTTATKKQMGERDETINGKIVKTVTNGIPNIDTINASINGARKQLVDMVNNQLHDEKTGTSNIK